MGTITLLIAAFFLWKSKLTHYPDLGTNLPSMIS